MLNGTSAQYRLFSASHEEAPVGQPPVVVDDDDVCIQADPDVPAFGVDVREDEAHVPAGDLHTSVQPTDVLNGGRR